MIDETGVSGTGAVAGGVQFLNGKVVICWFTEHSSIAVYDSIDDVAVIHGHGGSTEIVWLERVHFPSATDI